MTVFKVKAAAQMDGRHDFEIGFAMSIARYRLVFLRPDNYRPTGLRSADLEG